MKYAKNLFSFDPSAGKAPELYALIKRTDLIQAELNKLRRDIMKMMDETLKQSK